MHDRWTRQMISRNLSTPEQRAKATSLFIKLEYLVYLVITLGILIFLITVFL